MYLIMAGIPQGSVLGPPIWNIMYDDILRHSIAKQAVVVGNADGVEVVIESYHLDEVEIYAGRTT